MEIDSTNMQPEFWVRIAEAVYKNYDDYDGFVITHGTDTMGYTSAALSYMLQNMSKPVVITGSQVPIHNNHTDATITCVMLPGLPARTLGAYLLFLMAR